MVCPAWALRKVKSSQNGKEGHLGSQGCSQSLVTTLCSSGSLDLGCGDPQSTSGWLWSEGSGWQQGQAIPCTLRGRGERGNRPPQREPASQEISDTPSCALKKNLLLDVTDSAAEVQRAAAWKAGLDEFWSLKLSVGQALGSGYVPKSPARVPSGLLPFSLLGTA